MAKDAYEILDPDYTLSPRTGMNREHYIYCAKYLPGRAFKHIESFDRSIIFPMVPGKIYTVLQELGKEGVFQ